MKVTNDIKQGIETTKHAIINTERLLQAVSLLVMAGFSFWVIATQILDWRIEAIVLFCLIITGLRGAYEFIRFMGKR